MKILSYLIIAGVLLGGSDVFAIVFGYTNEHVDSITENRVDGEKVWDQRNAWGATEINKCSAEEKFDSEDGCVYGCGDGSNGKWAMIAQEVHEHGAKFCLTYVYVDRVDMTAFERPQTRYKSASAAPKPECVWLCQDGWTGDKCTTYVDADAQITCDPTPFKQTNYTGLKQGSNIESKIAMFFSWDYDCNDERFGKQSGTKYQEHDLILGVSEWLSSGHGAWVEPMTVRAWCPRGTAKEQTKVCKIIIDRRSVYSDSDDAKKLVCMNGYKPNAGETDCVPINNTACASMIECKGWSADQFADTTTYMRWPKDGCYEYRCAVGNYGFKQGTKECIECVDTETQKATYLEDTGECVFTDVSVRPVVNAKGALETAPREQTTRSELSAAKNGDGKPCWMVAETIGEYKECITGTTSN